MSSCRQFADHLYHTQYERFWTVPHNTPMAWVGLLFGMLRIAMLDYLREADEPLQWQGKCQDLAINFRNRFTDCMLAADYLQPQEFLIEALCLHHYGEYVSSRDAKSSVWVLSGMITRLAMRMGYHQASQPTLLCTPFQVHNIWSSFYKAISNQRETDRNASTCMGFHQTRRHHDVLPAGLTSYG